MSAISDLVRRMADAGASAELIAIAVEAIERPREELEARRASDRERKQRQRDRSRDGHGTVTGQSEEVTGLSADPLVLPPEVSPRPPSSPTNLSPVPPIVPQKSAKSSAYPEAFEAVWLAYPHAKGRSSKPKAVAEWRKLDADTRGALLPAVQRYRAEGREHRSDCGAKAFELWLRDARYLDWIAGEAKAITVDPWPGPADFREAAVASAGEDFVRSYLDPSGWRNGPDRHVLAKTGTAAERLTRELRGLLAQHGMSVRHERPGP